MCTEEEDDCTDRRMVYIDTYVPPIMYDCCALNKISKTVVNFHYFPVGDIYTLSKNKNGKNKRNNMLYIIMYIQLVLRVREVWI